MQRIGKTQCEHEIRIRHFTAAADAQERDAGLEMPVGKADLCFLHFLFRFGKQQQYFFRKCEIDPDCIGMIVKKTDFLAVCLIYEAILLFGMKR